MRTVSFYWYLYGAVAFALVLTVGTLFFAIEYTERQNDWEDFVEDIGETLSGAYIECGRPDLLDTCVAERIQFYGFEMSSDFYSHDSEFVAEIVDTWNGEQANLIVHSYLNGFQAQLSNHPSVWIRDNKAHLLEKKESSQTADMVITALLMTLVLFAGVALFLYWPIRRLMGWLSKLRDATDALAHEDYSVRLAKLNISPFAELSDRFNRMTALIQNNLEEKRLLANAMAHELRTPLSRTRLALGILQRKVTDESQLDLMDDLDRYIDELESVTENSLQLVRLQNSEPRFASIELHTWLSQKIARRKGLSSQVQWEEDLKPITVNCDETFLTLIIDNLLSNAEQYANTKVVIGLSAQTSGAMIEIQDDGPGIPDDLQQKALQPYSRLDTSRDRRSGGVGLGLALVNTACQRLNIQMKMVNRKSGLCVKLLIPDQIAS